MSTKKRLGKPSRDSSYRISLVWQVEEQYIPLFKSVCLPAGKYSFCHRSRRYSYVTPKCLLRLTWQWYTLKGTFIAIKDKLGQRTWAIAYASSVGVREDSREDSGVQDCLSIVRGRESRSKGIDGLEEGVKGLEEKGFVGAGYVNGVWQT